MRDEYLTGIGTYLHKDSRILGVNLTIYDKLKENLAPAILDSIGRYLADATFSTHDPTVHLLYKGNRMQFSVRLYSY